MRSRRNLPRLLAVILAAVLVSACAAGPQQAHWGVEECTHCRMVIGDERFAGQVVDRRGNTFKFDALECMAAWLAEERPASAELHSIWVASGREGWVRVEDASFLHSDALRSPMGSGYSAHPTADAARRAQQQVGGELLTWEEVRTRAAAHRHGGDVGHHDADEVAGPDASSHTSHTSHTAPSAPADEGHTGGGR
jgi:copper chaperone NosL